MGSLFVGAREVDLQLLNQSIPPPPQRAPVKSVKLAGNPPTTELAKARVGDSGALVMAPQRSKIDAMVALMRRRQGATMAELKVVCGWQAHSVRGAVFGPIAKKRGWTITSYQRGSVRVYRASRPPQDSLFDGEDLSDPKPSRPKNRKSRSLSAG